MKDFAEAAVQQQRVLSEGETLPVETFLAGKIAERMKLRAAEIDFKTPVTAFGIDSLAAIEIAHALEQEFGLCVSFEELLSGLTIQELVLAADKAVPDPLRAQPKADSREQPTFNPGFQDHQLSRGQEGLWVLHHMAPESPAYHICGALRVSPSLDTVALRRALEAVAARHPSLRTTFPRIAGKPVQRVHELPNVSLRNEDVSTWSDADLEKDISTEIHRPFDLQNGPLLRVTTYTFSNDRQLLVLVLHHIISDFWSQTVLFRELMQFYMAITSGTTVPLEEPPSFLEFVGWERHFLGSAEAEAHWKYWQHQLEGVKPEWNFPLDHPRPAAQTWHGAEISSLFELELSRGIKNLGRKAGATLYTTMLAIYFGLLTRYTGQDDLVVGSPVAGRGRPEWSEVIGYFANTVPLRANIHEDPVFSAFLGHVRETVLRALEHQHIPFSVIVDRLQPARIANRSPLFDTLFVFQQPPRVDDDKLVPMAIGVPGTRMNFNGTIVEPYVLHRQAAQFDWTLALGEVDERIAILIRYNTDLFDRATMERMLCHLHALSSAIVEDPDRPLSTYALASQAEMQKIISMSQGLASEPPRVACVSDLIEQQADRTPFAPAVMCEDRQLTYAELNARANCVAHSLLRMGVGPESMVALFVERSIDTVIGLLAVLKAGAAYIPLEPGDPDERLKMILGQVRPTVILTQSGLLTRLSEYAEQKLGIDAAMDSGSAADTINPQTNATDSNLAYIIFTSGSTGKPRGVAVERRQLLSYVGSILNRAGFPPAAHFASVSTIAADLGNTVIFAALCSGGCLHLVSHDTSLEPSLFAEYMSRNAIACLKIVPSHLSALLRGPDAGKCLPSDVLVLGGEALSWELAAKIHDLKPNCRVINHYGPTETTVGVLTAAVGAPSDRTGSTIVPIGYPLQNVHAYILDGDLRPVPPGISGELHIGGASVSRGYFEDPVATAIKFIPNLFGSTGDQLYKTGDLARYLEDGRIEFLRRIDQQLKIRGFRIEPGEIESLLVQHPSVLQAVVVPSDSAEGSLMACLVVDPVNPPQASELRRYLRNILPQHMVPSVFALLDEVPLTRNGKVDRSAVSSFICELLTEPEDGYVEPVTELERALAERWAQLLGVEKVGMHDGFFELGGNSLLATEMVSMIQDMFPSDTPLLIHFFQNPTLSGLAEAILQNCRDPEQIEKAAYLLKSSDFGMQV